MLSRSPSPSRSSRLAGLSALLLLSGLFLYAGCRGGSSDSPSESSSSEPGLKEGETVGLQPVFDGWKTPELVLLISGEMHGYIEPCGCSDTQSGGLARRADLVKQMKDRGWPVAAVDLGGLPNGKRASRQQSRIKFNTVMAALTDMNYTGIGLGPEELKLERGEPYYLLTQQSTEQPGAKPGTPSEPGKGVVFLSANIVLQNNPDLGVPLSHQLIEVGGKTIAVTSIMGQELWDSQFSRGNHPDITFTSPVEALREVLPKMQEAKPDLFVLLSHAPINESEQLAKEFPEFQLIVSAGFETPLPKPLRHENTLIVTLGHKGKHVGVVGLMGRKSEDASPTLKYELIDLDKERFASAPMMVEYMRYYQNELEMQEIAILEKPIPHPSGTPATYVGAARCGECHTKAYDKWKTTRHAKAYESLIEGREDWSSEWVSRVHDAECLACHVTGWDPQQALRYHDGFTSLEDTPNLKGQQCENCHGPGSEHSDLEARWKNDRKAVTQAELIAGRAQVKRSRATAEKQVCIKCHDYENSPKFDFDKYWQEVKHPWRD